MAQIMTSTPGISVVIPVYNRPGLVVEALDSVLAQAWPTLEVIVVDDGSTDGTAARVAAHPGRADNIVRLIQQPNRGESAARNAGIIAARQPFVAFLDSDDRWMPGKLAAQMEVFEQDPETDMVFSAYLDRRPTGLSTVILSTWERSVNHTLDRLLTGSCINTSTVVIRREVFNQVGLFDVSLRHCEDHDMWLRLASVGTRIAYVPQPLTDTRRQPDSLAAQPAEIARASELVIGKLFDSGSLPVEIQNRRRFHLARWHLNSAGRHLEAGDGRAAVASLVRATTVRPVSFRPGWLVMAGTALRLEWTKGRRLVSPSH